MRIRLLPVVLFAGGLLLTVKVGGLWQEVSVDAGRDSVAETPDESGGAPAALPAEPPAEAAGEGEATETAAAERAAPESLLEQTPPGSAADPLSYTDEELELLQSLAKRRDELAARETALGEREALLAATERRIDEKIAELKILQGTIESLVAQHDGEQEAQLKSLVKIYENMKPKDAAQIFQELELDVLLDVVERMQERKVAPVLAQMDPAKAREVTFELAQRRQLPLPN